MIKKYCDICEREIDKDNPEHERAFTGKASLAKDAGYYQFTFGTTIDIVFNVENFHICRKCIVDAIQRASI